MHKYINQIPRWAYVSGLWYHSRQSSDPGTARKRQPRKLQSMVSGANLRRTGSTGCRAFYPQTCRRWLGGLGVFIRNRDIIFSHSIQNDSPGNSSQWFPGRIKALLYSIQTRAQVVGPTPTVGGISGGSQ